MSWESSCIRALACSRSQSASRQFAIRERLRATYGSLPSRQFRRPTPAYYTASRQTCCVKSASVCRPVRPDRLLHQILEQLLDKRLVNLVAGGQESGQVAGAGELHELAVARQVRAAGIDRPALLLLPQPARGVESLQGKTQGIDRRMARSGRPPAGFAAPRAGAWSASAASRATAARWPSAAAAGQRPARRGR